MSYSRRACLVGVFLLHTVANAATIVSVTNPAAPSGTVLNSNIQAVSWTMPFNATGVAITASVYYQTSVNTLNAYLTTSVGPGAAIVASNTLTLGNSAKADIPLFTGLNLSAGTYYLVLSGTQAIWSFTNSPTVTTYPGVTNNPELFANGANGSPDFGTPPNSVLVATSTFTSDLHLFSVTGTEAPEPSSLALAGLGIVILGLRSRWRLQR